MLTGSVNGPFAGIRRTPGRSLPRTRRSFALWLLMPQGRTLLRDAGTLRRLVGEPPRPFRSQPAPQSEEHRRPQCQDTARCSLSWCGRAGVGPPGDCRFFDRSSRLWYAVVSVCRRPRGSSPIAPSQDASRRAYWRVVIGLRRSIRLGKSGSPLCRSFFSIQRPQPRGSAP